jgi:hypothetical protein
MGRRSFFKVAPDDFRQDPQQDSVSPAAAEAAMLAVTGKSFHFFQQSWGTLVKFGMAGVTQAVDERNP